MQSVQDCSETWKRAWNRRLTNGQFRMTNGHIFVTNGQFIKLGMITIIDFMEICGLVLVNFLFSIGICG